MPGIFPCISVLVIALMLIIFWRRQVNRWRSMLEARNQAQQIGQLCKCGYSLTELDQARCPECGRVRHFDATAEELGLTPEQLERAQRKRQERIQKGQPE